MAAPADLPTIIRAALQRAGVSGPGVVAVSGGADSVALLHALAPDRPTVAHLNHRLRGADSDADAAFVATLYPSLRHPIEAIDVAAVAAGDNLEGTARRVRYDFLARVAREVGATWVATGHTLDDQAETVLHRLLRGTGLRGLRGIAAVRELVPGILLVRPMLRVSRADVIAHLTAGGHAWREDATNRDPAFTRNRIRHELLPLLRTFNPAVESVLGRLAVQAEEQYRDVEAEAECLLTAAELAAAGGTAILNRDVLGTASDQSLREMFVTLWVRRGWPRNGMTSAHWDRLLDVVRGRAPAWDLPGGLRVTAGGRVVRVGPASRTP
jgi:tRNA(Ile)-lysidine synthase